MLISRKYAKDLNDTIKPILMIKILGYHNPSTFKYLHKNTYGLCYTVSHL